MRVAVMPTSCCMDGLATGTVVRWLRASFASITPTVTSVTPSPFTSMRLYPMYTISPVFGSVLPCAVMLSSQ